MGQFIGVLRPDGFRDPEGIHADMASTFSTLRGARIAPGRDRVFIHGEPESDAESVNRAEGIPVTPNLLEQMRTLDAELDLGFAL